MKQMMYVSIGSGQFAHQRYEHWLRALAQEQGDEQLAQGIGPRKKHEQLAQGIGPRCAICMITNEDFVSGIHPLNF